MQAPKQVAPKELAKQVEKWLEDHTIEVRGDSNKPGYNDDHRVCSECDSTIKVYTAWMSIHDSIFGDSCAGMGEVKRIALPYCPKCEPDIEKAEDIQRGCIHI